MRLARRPDRQTIGEALAAALATLNRTSQWIGMNAMGDLPKAFACSVPYLRLWGTVAGGWQMARAAQIAADKVAAGDAEADFYRAKLATARSTRRTCFRSAHGSSGRSPRAPAT